MNKLIEVFGVARAIPLTYISRSYVDEKFINALSRDKHIVLHGSSKQGKSCLRRQCLKGDGHVVVQCGNDMTREQIYELLLKQAGAFATQNGDAPHLDVDIDPTDVDDIIRALELLTFTKFVLLEDFHYLPYDVQRDLAFDLKAFHEKSSVVFIVIGVWREPNRLVQFNPDLAGRLIAVDADRWDTIDLERVITTGEKILNVEFHRELRKEMVLLCQGNVGVLQEVCFRLCESQNVLQTCFHRKSIDDVEEVKEIARQVWAEQAVRHFKTPAESQAARTAHVTGSRTMARG